MPSLRRFYPRGRDPRPEIDLETVAVVRAYTTVSPRDGTRDVDEATFEERDARLYQAASRSAGLINAQLRQSVNANLGPEFEVPDVQFARGSLELVAAIVLAGSVVMTYGAVRSGLDYIREDAGHILSMALYGAVPGGKLEIASYVTLGPAMSKFALAEPSNQMAPAPSMTYLTVMGTLVVTALLTTLLVVVFVKVL
jgi:hypothetical protein